MKKKKFRNKYPNELDFESEQELIDYDQRKFNVSLESSAFLFIA